MLTIEVIRFSNLIESLIDPYIFFICISISDIRLVFESILEVYSFILLFYAFYISTKFSKSALRTLRAAVST